MCRFADGLCDKNKETIKRKIRSEIFRHEEYPDCSWSLSKDRIDELKKICDSISFENQAYDFLYLSQTDGLPIYRPPFENVGISDELEEHDKKIDSILRVEFIRFKSLNIDLEEFLSLVENDSRSQIGKCIGRYYSNGKYDEEILRQILSSNCSKKIVIDYIMECEGNSTDTKMKALDFVIENGRDDIVPLILSRIPFNSETIDILNKMPENIVDDFWIESEYAIIEDCDKSLCYFIQNQIKYKKYNEAVINLRHCVNKIKPEKIISFLNKIAIDIHNDSDKITSDEIWALNDLLLRLEDKAKNDPTLFRQLADTEIYFIGILEFNNLGCVKALASTSPMFFTNIAYFASNDTPSSYYLYYDVTFHWKFCPGYCDGTIQEGVYSNWIKVFTEHQGMQGKGEMVSSFLGYLFACSPIGDDGHFPHELIRETIEDIGDERLLNCCYCGISNRRGVVQITNGDSDFALAEKYKKEADFLKCLYPKTAKIFECLSSTYEDSGKEIREDAENMGSYPQTV